MSENEYNPLDYENLTHNLVRELMSRDARPLPPTDAFDGSGVYALFYNGNFKPYGPVCSPDASKPIYVGKAVPPGARKGGGGSLTSRALHGRLNEHSASIEAAENLDTRHFRCRYLVVVPLWITMAERLLIEQYRPIWNVCIEGFGIHAPGSGREEGLISWWDVLHPGRLWAARLKQGRTADQAVAKLRQFLAGRTVEETPQDGE